jgi:hypothetical protein
MHEVTDHEERLRLSTIPLRTWAPGDRDHLVVVRPRSVSGRQIPHHTTDSPSDGG